LQDSRIIQREDGEFISDSLHDDGEIVTCKKTR